jgi:hypothetical protein
MQGLKAAAGQRISAGSRSCVPRHAGATGRRAGATPCSVPAAVSMTAVSRLPSTHLESSKKALELLKAQSVNREWTAGVGVGA